MSKSPIELCLYCYIQIFLNAIFIYRPTWWGWIRVHLYNRNKQTCEVVKVVNILGLVCRYSRKDGKKFFTCKIRLQFPEYPSKSCLSSLNSPNVLSVGFFAPPKNNVALKRHRFNSIEAIHFTVSWRRLSLKLSRTRSMPKTISDKNDDAQREYFFYMTYNTL